MFVQKQTVTLTTAADGTATVYSTVINGRVFAIKFTLGTLTSGAADVTVTGEDSAVQLWAVTNAAANATVQPRVATHDSTGTALTYDGTRVQADYYHAANERIKAVVAQGGDTKTGTLEIWWG
jgi:hypothetical protein